MSIRKHPGFGDRETLLKWWVDRFMWHWVLTIGLVTGQMIAFAVQYTWPESPAGIRIFVGSIFAYLAVDALVLGKGK